jgi:epsilon-lactone hydrolase
MRCFGALLAAVLMTLSACRNAERPRTDSSTIAPDGTAYVTRVVPVPATVSREAQKVLARVVSDAAHPETLSERRARTDQWQSAAGEAFRKIYPVNIQADSMAGVPVRVITPPSIPPAKRNRVLVNLHGGGFNSDSGSFTESIPVAYLSETKVIAVLYRLAPEHPFPAGLDDAVAVYRELLKTYPPRNIGVYGTSAGAILTAEMTAKLKQLQLPLPGATGIFSGLGDFSQAGDSMALFSLDGLAGHLDPPDPAVRDADYRASTDSRDPILSPLYSDLRGFPPALFITSGRDLLLSGTILLHRAYLRAGVDAQLVVFEALPHAFWNNPELPESREAHQLMSEFLDKHLGR